MKKQMVSLSFFLLFTSTILLCGCTQTENPVTPDNTKQLHGYIYNSDGTPAMNAKVSLVPSNSIPSNALFKKADEALPGSTNKRTSSATADGITDKNGKYSFSFVPADTYNIFGEGNGNLSFHPLVTITADNNPISVANDTLRPPGSLKGKVITNPPMDSRRIFIIFIGGYVVRWPDDSAGNFILSDMAEGTYRLRFLPTDQNTPVYDTIVTVISGKETDLGTILLETDDKRQARIDSISAAYKAEKDSIVKNYLMMKFGVLIYFNMGTFAVDPKLYPEIPLPAINESTFDPRSLNCGQWVDAVKASGAKYIILTVKHDDGFCLWNSSTTDHDVGNCLWAQGKRDIVKEFSDSAHSRGLLVGFYYSIVDLQNGAQQNSIKIKNQLTELLSNYGPVTCLYFNGFINIETYTLVNSLQKNCIIIGDASESQSQLQDIIGYYHLQSTGYTKDYTKLLDYDAPPNAGVMQQAEAIESILPWYWFWHKSITEEVGLPYNESDILVPQRIVDRLNACNAVKENYIISVSPDTTGLLPQCQVDCLKSVDTIWNKR